MSVQQLVQGIVYALSGTAARVPFTWPDLNQLGNPGEPVLGRVFVAAVVSSHDMQTRDAVVPFAIVRPGAVKWSREHPEAWADEVRLTLILIGANANDQAGGAAIVGATRAGQGSSQGRGLLDVEAAVLGRLASTPNASGGAPLSLRPAGETAMPPEVAKMEGLVVARAIEVVAVRVPAQPTFAPVRRPVALKSGSDAAMTWQAPPDTYDLVGILVARSSGTTPPATPSGAGITQLTTLGPAATGYTDPNPGSGTWSYSLFGVFDTGRDPATGIRAQGTPLVDRYSGFTSVAPGSTAAFVYAPATATVTI